MKKLIIFVATLLFPLMLNAQNTYVEFWGRYNYNKKKVKKDSLLVLARSIDQKVYQVYKKGTIIDVLYHRNVEYQHEYKKVRMQERDGKFYIDNYEIIMADSTLIKEIRSLYGSRLGHGSHFSHSSHASHYSSSF